MKFTVDTVYFDTLREEDKAVKLWKDLEDARHIAFIPTVVLAEFFSTVYERWDKSRRRDKLERILKFKDYKEGDPYEGTPIPITNHEYVPSLFLVDTNQTLSVKAGRIKEHYNIPLGDSYVVATHILNENSNFILTEDKEHFEKVANSRKDVRIKSIKSIK